MTDVVRLWEELGRSGFAVSVCYGPSRDKGLIWSVQMLGPQGEEFAVPFKAKNLRHALWIARMEIMRRGYAVPPEIPA